MSVLTPAEITGIPWYRLPLAGCPHLAAALDVKPDVAHAMRIEWLDDMANVKSNTFQIFREVLGVLPVSAPRELMEDRLPDKLRDLAARLDQVIAFGVSNDAADGRSMDGVFSLLGEDFAPSKHRLRLRVLSGRDLKLVYSRWVAVDGEEFHGMELFVEVSLEAVHR